MKKTLDQFNDVALLKIAQSCYYKLPSRERTEEVGEILKKDALSNQERNQLLFLIESSRYLKQTSITEMKQQIFDIIGFKTSNHYGTVSRAELEAIYNYVMRQPGQN